MRFIITFIPIILWDLFLFINSFIYLLNINAFDIIYQIFISIFIIFIKKYLRHYSTLIIYYFLNLSFIGTTIGFLTYTKKYVLYSTFLSIFFFTTIYQFFIYFKYFSITCILDSTDLDSTDMYFRKTLMNTYLSIIFPFLLFSNFKYSNYLIILLITSVINNIITFSFMHRVFIIKINNRNINPENISALTFRDCINAFINTITIIVYLIENTDNNAPSSFICGISILLLLDNYIVTIAINQRIKNKLEAGIGPVCW